MFNFGDTRYNRQIQMPEWGERRQKLLRRASVVVIGAGGVKSTLLMCLASAGIGNIRIIEFDKVELSNLNRQLLYKTEDIGRYKGERAREFLQNLNPTIAVELVKEKVTPENIDNLLNGFPFVVEGGDSPSGRNLVNSWCLKNNTPFVHASAQFSYGYVFSVVPEEKTSCFACFFPEDYTRQEHTGPVPVNVLATSIAGSLGAAEVIKWFLGYRDRLIVNRKLCFSSLLLSGEFGYEDQERRKDCPICSIYY